MLVLLAAFSSSVLPGTEEVHPKLSFQKCSKSGCTTQNGAVVIDSEWRSITDSEGRNCIRSEQDWNTDVCNGPEDCAAKCQLNGFDYKQASVSTSGSSVRLGFVNPDGSVGSRVYLFDEDTGKYVNFKLLNKKSDSMLTPQLLSAGGTVHCISLKCTKTAVCRNSQRTRQVRNTARDIAMRSARVTVNSLVIMRISVVSTGAAVMSSMCGKRIGRRLNGRQIRVAFNNLAIPARQVASSAIKMGARGIRIG
jgi:hypothetical protein